MSDIHGGGRGGGLSTFGSIVEVQELEAPLTTGTIILLSIIHFKRDW